MNWLRRLRYGSGVTVRCPDCGWNESVAGEDSVRAQNVGGLVLPVKAGQCLICLNCGAPWVASAEHGAYRANQLKLKRALDGVEPQPRLPQDGKPKDRLRMPVGMEDMRARPEG